MTLDLTKPVQTKCGLPVRILCIDRAGGQPVIGLVKQADGTEAVHSWYVDGRFFAPTRDAAYDLINVPPEPMYRYRNIYEDKRPGDWRASIEAAVQCRSRGVCVAVQKRTIIGDKVTNEFIPV